MTLWWWPWKKKRSAPVSYKDGLAELLDELARPGDAPSREWKNRYVERHEDPLPRLWDECVDGNVMLALLAIVGARPEIVIRSRGRLCIVLGDDIHPIDIEPLPPETDEDDPRRDPVVRLRTVEAADEIRRIIPVPPTFDHVLTRRARRMKAIAEAKKRAAETPKPDGG